MLWQETIEKAYQRVVNIGLRVAAIPLKVQATTYLNDILPTFV